jgi:Zn-dependent protease
MTCPGCNQEFADAALSCPECRRLVHSSELEGLAARAKEAWRVGRFAEERALWEQSLALLPEDTVQFRSIQARVAEIANQTSSASAPSGFNWGKASKMGAGPILLLLLAKGKFLLLGLTKIGTLLTMVVSLGVYWSIYGWGLAVGAIVSIYIHEMGHVAAIRRFGFQASAPMFIPGLGALIQLRTFRLPPIPDARIGLAGPLYGLGAALAAFGAYLVTHAPIWAVIAHFGAVINLFNLTPIWQLDGSRGFHSLSRPQRAIVVAAALILGMLTHVTMLYLIAAVGAWRVFTRDWQSEDDQQGLMQFLGLLLALSALAAFTAAPAAISKTL